MPTWRTNSCCCFTLRTGVLIMGWMGVIFDSILAISCIGLMFASKATLDSIIAEADKGEDTPLTPEEYDVIITVIKVSLGITAGIGILGFIISLLMLLGVYQQKEKYLKITVIISVIMFVISCIYHLIKFFAGVSHGAYGQAFAGLIGSVISILLHLYLIVVIHSYRMQIIEQPKRGAPHQQF